MIKDELDEYRGYGARWLGRVQQIYKEKQTLATARAKGYTLKSREVIETSQGEQVRPPKFRPSGKSMTWLSPSLAVLL